MLTKSEILEGVNLGVRVLVPELEGEVTLYPLSEGEWAQVELMQSQGVDVRLDMPTDPETGEPTGEVVPVTTIDSRVAQESQRTADAMAVRFSLSRGGEAWSLEDVRAIRPAVVVERLAVEVYRITRVEGNMMDRVRGGLEARGLTAEAVQFRDDEAGEADSGSDTGGDAAGE